MTTMTSDEILVRWAIRRDFDRMMEIERASYDDPWTESEMINWMRGRTQIAMVACVGELVVGFILYEIQARHLQIVSVSVDPDWRRSGVGSVLVQKVQRKIGTNGKPCCHLLVRETNFVGLRFFQSLGFVAAQLVPRPWERTDEDGYRMVYEKGGSRLILRNRIKSGKK